LSILGPYKFRLCYVHKWRVVPLSLVRSNLEASGEDRLPEVQVLGQVRPWSENCIDAPWLDITDNVRLLVYVLLRRLIH
jgi:hypothetical protein